MYKISSNCVADNDDFPYLDSHNVKREDHLLMKEPQKISFQARKFVDWELSLTQKISKLGKMLWKNFKVGDYFYYHCTEGNRLGKMCNVATLTKHPAKLIIEGQMGEHRRGT